ncbi:hypothetical protein CapIbe_013824 [Capra ibex]
MPADRRARQDLRPGKSWRSAICWVTAPGSRFGVTRVPAPQKPSPSAGRDTSPQHPQLLPKPSGLRLAHLRWLRGEPGGSGRAPLRSAAGVSAVRTPRWSPDARTSPPGWAKLHHTCRHAV